MTKEQLLIEIKSLTAKDRQWLLAEAKKTDKVSIKVAKAAYINFYRDKYKEEYYWEGKDSGCMSALLSKIRAKMIENNFTPITEQTISANMIALCEMSIKKDEWIANHFCVANLNSQFNIIYNRLKHGKQEGNKSSLADYAEQLISGN
jgi:hypothetical protein